jgi:hypothetical protein
MNLYITIEWNSQLTSTSSILCYLTRVDEFLALLQKFHQTTTFDKKTQIQNIYI